MSDSFHAMVKTDVKERPILFSGPMVRAILEGRKTVTRRVVKPQPQQDDEGHWYVSGGGGGAARTYFVQTAHDRATGRELSRRTGGERETIEALVRCPYGVPGDRLWVRETWCHHIDEQTAAPTGRYFYRATQTIPVVKVDGDGFQVFKRDGTEASPWHPSIFMPRWASRVTLDVTGVRVERLQEMGVVDALQEGIGNQLPLENFRSGWNSIHAKRPAFQWAANPWVWVVAFKRSLS